MAMELMIMPHKHAPKEVKVMGLQTAQAIKESRLKMVQETIPVQMTEHLIKVQAAAKSGVKNN
jgi:hypothetical protein